MGRGHGVGLYGAMARYGASQGIIGSWGGCLSRFLREGSIIRGRGARCIFGGSQDLLNGAFPNAPRPWRARAEPY